MKAVHRSLLGHREFTTWHSRQCMRVLLARVWLLLRWGPTRPRSRLPWCACAGVFARTKCSRGQRRTNLGARVALMCHYCHQAARCGRHDASSDLFDAVSLDITLCVKEGKKKISLNLVYYPPPQDRLARIDHHPSPPPHSRPTSSSTPLACGMDMAHCA